ncbi:MAG: hypothetical protein JWQ45_2065 [Blastococcus sp.]|nr:hypothetical protein [Blastococcus sp.]
MTAQRQFARRAVRRACLLLVLLAVALLPVPGPAVPGPVLPGPAAPSPTTGARLSVAAADPGPDLGDARPGMSVAGNLLLRDGEPFLPAGFNLIGLLTPAWCAMPETEPATAGFGQPELDAAHAWHANTLRFQVSQRGLADPAVPQADRDAYLDRVIRGVALARASGFVVLVSMQDQRYGCGEIHPLPSSETLDAWTALAPRLMADPYVGFELFNEPRNEDDAAGWAQWRDGGTIPDPNRGDAAVGHQELVDHLRSLGSRNVLLADAARLGERTTGMPRLADPAGNLAYAVHPYYFTPGPAWWDRQYGTPAAEVPVVATEWNYRADGCGTAEQRLAPALLDYLRRHHIGVLGHAFDAPGTTVTDLSGTPTECGTAAGGSGRLLRDFLAGLQDRDLVPPAPPRDVRVVHVDRRQVQVAWSAGAADSGPVSYLVVRNGAVIATASGSNWIDRTVRPRTRYTYLVRAVDAAGNISGNSVTVGVATPVLPR